MNININFDDIYNIESLEPDLSRFVFKSPVSDIMSIEIIVKIEPAFNPFLLEFFNMSFGPAIEGEHNRLDDFAKVPHVNPSKTFSTILFCGLLYLQSNKGNYLDFDGSDFRRAYLYYRTIQRNFNYLSNIFKLVGIKYYARVIRGKDKNDLMTVDESELTFIPYLIENHPLTNHKSLFNYFTFYLK